MGDSAGLTTLAVVGLWFAYLVPHKLRHRQQLLESRTDDRFSGSLRVLAVTSGTSLRRTPDTRGEDETGAPKRIELLTPGRGVPVEVQGAPAPRGVRAVERPHATADRVSADVARRAAQQRAAHAAAVARRGAAARRRAVLTVVLLTASLAGWAVVGLTTLTVAAGVAPTVLLGTVLVMGRRAVVAGQAADAAWESRVRRGADLASMAPEGASSAVRTEARRSAPVVGRAVHPSDAHTEVIARISDTMSAEQLLGTATHARGAARPGRAERPSGAARPADVTDAAGEEWVPVPVPRPTYTMKASAPRREPAPLTDEDIAPTELTTASPASTRVTVSAETLLAPASDTPTGSIDLDAVLARRRASGQ